MLNRHGLIGSTSRRENPSGTSNAESMNALKCESAYVSDLEQSPAEIHRQACTADRLHNAIGYLTRI
jgi:hypothetical protein